MPLERGLFNADDMGLKPNVWVHVTFLAKALSKQFDLEILPNRKHLCCYQLPIKTLVQPEGSNLDRFFLFCFVIQSHVLSVCNW